MFDTFISRPVFNILTLIYALVPGHNLGVTIILFTVLMRVLLWPLLKKQLHQQKKMRELQPLIKDIKKQAAGDKKLEMEMTQALYKTKEINPFSTLPLLFAQMPILIALFQGLRKIIKDPYQVVDRSYDFIKHIPHMQAVAADISKFDNTFLKLVDLTRPAVAGGKGFLGLSGGKFYGPAVILVVLSGAMQWYQSKRLMSSQQSTKSTKKFRELLAAQSQGEEVDQSEMMAAQMRVMQYILPGMIIAFTIGQSAGLALYLLVSSGVQLLQQARIIKDEVQLLEDSVPDVEVVEKTPKKVAAKPKKSSKNTIKSAAKTVAKSPTMPDSGVRVGESGKTTIRRVSK
jgi:YidC/Oxa1 family membrane protein insertase